MRLRSIPQSPHTDASTTENGLFGAVAKLTIFVELQGDALPVKRIFFVMSGESQTSLAPGVTDPHTGRPRKIGLYDPANEHDACGVGFIADLKGKQTRDTVNNAITMLEVI